jgi:glycolate oxidase
MYGIPNEYIVGLEVVLANGNVIKTGAGANPRSKSIFRYCNGPDLTGLFLGSHGTLGIITTVTYKLQKRHQKEMYLDYIFDSLEKTTQCAIDLTKTGFCGLIMQFPKLFYRQAGLDLKAEGGGLMINVFGDEQDIEYRTKIVEQIVTKYTNMKPEMLAPGFNARDLAKYRHWCCVNGRWAEVTGYLSFDKANEYMMLCQDYVEQNRSIIDETTLVPQYGLIYTQNCVNIFFIFLVYDPNEKAIKAAKALTEHFSEKSFDFGVSPYWIGKEYSQTIFSRLNKNYVTLYAAIKGVLDPNNILNPGLFSVQ